MIAYDLPADVAEYERRSPHAAGIGPSDIGACRRQVAYRVRETTPDRPDDPRLARSAFLGRAVHEALANMNVELHPTWLVEAQVRVPGMDRDGTVDFYDPEQALVGDYKTKGARGFESILTRGQAYDADVLQVELYGLALLHTGREVKQCAVVYVSRDGGSDPFIDSWTFDHQRAVQSAAKLHALQDAIDDGQELPRDGNGPDTGRPCDSCRWIATCWQLDKVPPGYTAQSAFLAPEEVAEAADTLRMLREEQRKLKEATDYLRLKLEGHDGAEFVDAEGIRRRVKWTPGRRTGGQLDSEAVRDRYAELGETPPTLGTAPKVTTPAVP